MSAVTQSICMYEHRLIDLSFMRNENVSQYYKQNTDDTAAANWGDSTNLALLIQFYYTRTLN